MYDSKYQCALEKFTSAIWTLATAPGDVRERLLMVFQSPLLLITPEHLPDDLREDYEWIQQQITKYDEKYKGQKKWLHDREKHDPDFGKKHPDLYPNPIEATLRRIRRSTGSHIAIRVYKIFDTLKTRMMED